jgi:hypothetical protein
MSSIMQPPSPSKPKLPSWITAEWDRISAMPIPTLLLLAGITSILMLADPLLPFVGYGLQIWAAHSWHWRSRWASIGMLSRQGGWFLAWLGVLAILADTHIWFFPTLAGVAQDLWHAIHLPGDLGILPFKNDLFARCVLFLPLAPTVALVYEHIGPRTEVDPRRRLLPEDLVTPSVPPSPAPQQSAASTSAPTQKHEEEQKGQAADASAPTQEPKPEEKKKRAPRSTRTSKQHTHVSEAQQMTIDSFLAPSPDQVQQRKTATTRSARSTTGSSSTTEARKKKQGAAQDGNTPAPEVSSSPPTPPTQTEAINWNDVAE